MEEIRPVDYADEDLRAAKRECVNRFLRTPTTNSIQAAASSRRDGYVAHNVVGVGIGDKVVDHEFTGTSCVKLYVRKKYQATEATRAQRLPMFVGGIPTDVEEVGEIRALQLIPSWPRHGRLRPAPCGISVAHYDVSAGTIGAIVRKRGRIDDGCRYILSNNHVLANCNNARIGDAILQPGPTDGGQIGADEIGTLARFVPIEFGGDDNAVDVALAEVDGSTVLANIYAIGDIHGTVRAQRRMVVQKHGRTTGLTRGIVDDVSADIRVEYKGGKSALFSDTVAVRGIPPTVPFSAGGDSGAAVVDESRHVCALLFAGTTGGDLTYAIPIALALRKLGVRLL